VASSPPSSTSSSAPTSAPVRDADVTAWVTKARERSTHLLSLAGTVADPAEVVGVTVNDPNQWAFGNFMLAWLEGGVSPREVRHLPDASFFLDLLRVAYAPVLAEHPEYVTLLTDSSRPEMSLTNDVLQIQLDGLVDGYSMVRNHALMLFTAALWLEEPQRSLWLALYDDLVTWVDSRPEGRPDLETLARVEKAAFEDFVALAPRTLDAESARALLADTDALENILGYQLYAAVAIGLLWRDYRSMPEDQRDEWYRLELSERYADPEYLTTKWMER
jgi:hypothetical protein